MLGNICLVFWEGEVIFFFVESFLFFIVVIIILEGMRCLEMFVIREFWVLFVFFSIS